MRFPWQAPHVIELPPEPEPTWTELGYEWATTVVTVLLLFTLVLVAARSFLRARWPVWFEAAARAAFEKVDTDASGNVDREELYAGMR